MTRLHRSTASTRLNVGNFGECVGSTDGERNIVIFSGTAEGAQMALVKSGRRGGYWRGSVMRFTKTFFGSVGCMMVEI